MYKMLYGTLRVKMVEINQDTVLIILYLQV